MTDAGWRRAGIAAVLLGAGVRAWWCLLAHPAFDYVYADMQGYLQRATQLASGVPLGRFGSYYPPGTHLLLAGPLAIFGTGRAGEWAAVVLWWLLSCALPLATLVLVRRAVSSAAGAVAAGLVSLYPLFVVYGGFFTSETPALALLAATMLAATWTVSQPRRARDAVCFGLAAGALLVVRPQLLLNVAVIAVPVAFALRRALRSLLLVALGGLAVVVPVLVMNATYAGHVVGISEADGLNVFLAQCDAHQLTMDGPQRYHFVFANPVALQQDRGADYHFVDHPPWDRSFYLRRGLECARDDGVSHVGILARNLTDMTTTSTPWPLVNEDALSDVGKWANIVYCWTVGLVVLPVGLVRLVRRRLDAWQGSLLLQLGVVVPIALVFAGEPRLRLTTDLFGLLFLATIAGQWLDRRSAGRTAPER